MKYPIQTIICQCDFGTVIAKTTKTKTIRLTFIKTWQFWTDLIETVYSYCNSHFGEKFYSYFTHEFRVAVVDCRIS